MGELKILIVDDHEAVRRTLRALLRDRSGWVVCAEAADGLEAVEKTRLLRPDVVVMDVSMPRMDGIAATRIIRQHVPEADVIIISQNDPAVVRRQAADVDAYGFVSKERLGFALVPLIDRIVERRQLAFSDGESRL
jgi:DNA-binding NarL/FixJ family response regulator